MRKNQTTISISMKQVSSYQPLFAHRSVEKVRQMRPLLPLEYTLYQKRGLLCPDYRLARASIDNLHSLLKASVALVNPSSTPPMPADLKQDAFDDFLCIPNPHTLHQQPAVHGLNPQRIAQAWLHYATLPSVIDMVESVLGEDILFWGSTLLINPAKQSLLHTWQQDSTATDQGIPRWPLQPSQGCCVMMALQGSTHALFQYVASSHRHGPLHASAFEVLQNAVQDMPREAPHADLKTSWLEKGCLNLYSPHVMYRFNPLAQSPAVLLCLRYAPASCLWPGEPTYAPPNPLFLVRNQGHTPLLQGAASPPILPKRFQHRPWLRLLHTGPHQRF